MGMRSPIPVNSSNGADMVPNKKCAFLTMEDLSGFFAYDHLAAEPMAALGWQLEEIPWNRAGVHWDDFDAVVIRSPWDYQDRPGEFLSVLEQIDASAARLFNPLDIVRWNLEKTYLRDLQQRGVSIVPTRWLFEMDADRLEALQREFDTDQIILKPVIGANADDTFRLGRDSSQQLVSSVIDLFRSRQLLAQPFIPSIVDVGEYSLFYLGGTYSHCILKAPADGDFRVQEEHGGQIRAAEPDEDLLMVGRQAIRAIGQELLYARVDLVRLPCGSPALMELELIEPSLYFPYDPLAPRRFAEALDRCV